MSYTLVDHGLTPFSELEEVDQWLARIKDMLKESPEDEGLLLALQDIKRIRELVVQRQAQP
jgi:hypothetical protein